MRLWYYQKDISKMFKFILAQMFVHTLSLILSVKPADGAKKYTLNDPIQFKQRGPFRNVQLIKCIHHHLIMMHRNSHNALLYLEQMSIQMSCLIITQCYSVFSLNRHGAAAQTLCSSQGTLLSWTFVLCLRFLGAVILQSVLCAGAPSRPVHPPAASAALTHLQPPHSTFLILPWGSAGKYHTKCFF